MSGGEPAELDVTASAGRNRETDRGPHLQVPAERGAQKKGGFRWRRPRHSLKGRQVAEAVERSGVRLQLLRQQAEAGDIILLFQDESEALTHPYLAHAWAKQGADIRIEAPGQAVSAECGAGDPAFGRQPIAALTRSQVEAMTVH